MQINLFQFGEHRLHIRDQKVRQHYSTTSGAENRRFLFSHRKSPVDMRWMNDDIKIEMSGYLEAKPDVNLDGFVQKMKGMVGVPTILIAYYLYDDYPTFTSCSCNCNRRCGCKIQWLSAWATLTEVRPDRSDAFGLPELKVEFILSDFWRALDTHKWKWTNGGVKAHPFATYNPGGPTVDEYLEKINPCPTCDMLFSCNDCYHSFVPINYGDCEYKENFEYWDALFNCECAHCTHDAGIARSLESTNRWYEVTIDPNKWSAPSLTWWKITGFRETIFGLDRGSINLRIIHEDNSGLGFRQDVVNFNIDQADLDLSNNIDGAARPPIQPNDTLVFGEIRHYIDNILYSPAYLIRETGTIQKLYFPRLNYKGHYPGILYPGLNRYYVSHTENQPNLQVSMVSIFRRM